VLARSRRMRLISTTSASGTCLRLRMRSWHVRLAARSALASIQRSRTWTLRLVHEHQALMLVLHEDGGGDLVQHPFWVVAAGCQRLPREIAR
jgi:hypothetical protein